VFHKLGKSGCSVTLNDYSNFADRRRPLCRYSSLAD